VEKPQYIIKHGLENRIRRVFKKSDGPKDWLVFTPEYLSKITFGEHNLFEAINSAYQGRDWFSHTLPLLLRKTRHITEKSAENLANRVHRLAEYAQRVDSCLKAEYELHDSNTKRFRIKIRQVGEEWCQIHSHGPGRAWSRLPILGGLYLQLYQDNEGRLFWADETAVCKRDPILLDAIQESLRQLWMNYRGSYTRIMR